MISGSREIRFPRISSFLRIVYSLLIGSHSRNDVMVISLKENCLSKHLLFFAADRINRKFCSNTSFGTCKVSVENQNVFPRTREG